VKLLALDTTSDFGSIALLEGAELIEQVALHQPDGFAHTIFQEIEALLSRHGLTIHDIDVFASASGPGSFTGVRVGLTAVKGLAEATGRKVVAVSNLQALAWFGTRPQRATLIDARRGEVYGAVYDADLRSVQPEVVESFDRWMKTLPEGDLEIVTQGFDPVGATVPVVHAPRELAHAIGVIAAGKIAVDPIEIDANYVRRSDAELFWKET
jgi:tRNA threonylcarbamoyladenosine biosynthesis protein TsaB